jgi:Trypsin-like peptidase domain/Effector-associated domain 1
MAPPTRRTSLSADVVQTLTEAVLDAYTYDELRQAVFFGTGRRIERELNVQRGERFVFQDLIELAGRGGWVDTLMRVLVVERPDNPWLRETALMNGFGAPIPPAPNAQEPHALEKVVRSRGAFVNFADFITRLAPIARRMCRVDVGRGATMGTGWLVSQDLVLTNYHVVEAVCERRFSRDAVLCRFDLSHEGIETTAPVSGLAADWLVDHSRYSATDSSGTGDPGEDELDYAVLRLAQPLGAVVVNGQPRGWIQLTTNPPAVGQGDILLVSQHAQGRPLELTFGQVLDYNGNSTRIRHDANTEPGSSGSPCFTVELQAFGLHHAGGPGTQFKYNQCIPVRRVIERLTEKGIEPFWTVSA